MVGFEVTPTTPSSSHWRNCPDTSQLRRMLSSHGLVPAAARSCSLVMDDAPFADGGQHAHCLVGDAAWREAKLFEHGAARPRCAEAVAAHGCATRPRN